MWPARRTQNILPHHVNNKKKGGGSQKNIFKKRWLKKVPEPVAAKEYEVRGFFMKIWKIKIRWGCA